MRRLSFILGTAAGIGTFALTATDNGDGFVALGFTALATIGVTIGVYLTTIIVGAIRSFPPGSRALPIVSLLGLPIFLPVAAQTGIVLDLYSFAIDVIKSAIPGL